MVAGNTPGRVKARRAAAAQAAVQVELSETNLLERQLSTMYERSQQLRQELLGRAGQHGTILTVLEGIRLVGDAQVGAPRIENPAEAA